MPEKKDDSLSPAIITPELCEAYRAVLDEKIIGLRNTIITGLAVSTAIISIIVTIVNLALRQP